MGLSNPRAIRQQLLERDGPGCRYCERDDEDELTIEHLTPVSRGGRHDLQNLALSCLRCNHWKGHLTDDEYRGVMGDHAARKALLHEKSADYHSVSRDQPRRTLIANQPPKKTGRACGRCRRGWHGACVSMCWCPEYDCWTGAGAMAL